MVHLTKDSFGNPEFVSISKAFENAQVRKGAGVAAVFAVATGLLAYIGAYKAAAILSLPTFWQYLETWDAVNTHGRFRPKWME